MSSHRKTPEVPPTLLLKQALTALARPSPEELRQLNDQQVRRTGFGIRFEMVGQGPQGFMELALPSGGLRVFRSTFTLVEPHETIGAADRDCLRIRLGLSGDMKMSLESGEPVDIGAPSAMMIVQPKGTEFRGTSLPLQSFRQVNLILPRGTLTEDWGFDLATLPELLRVLEAGEARQVQYTCIPLTPALANIGTDILECGFTGPLLDQYLESKVRETLCLLIAALQQPQSSADTAESLRLTQQDRQHLAKARQIIDGSFSSPPGLTTLARRVGLNRNKLCAGFQAEYGQTIHEYARELRLQKALQMLREGGVSITEVALEVGYEHSSSLTTAVKKRFGVSPRQLRQTSRRTPKA